MTWEGSAVRDRIAPFFVAMEVEMDGNETSSDLSLDRSPEFIPPASGDLDLTAPTAQAPLWQRLLLPAIGGMIIVGGIGWVLFNRLILPMMMGAKPIQPPATPVQLTSPKVAIIQDSSDYAASLESRQSVRIQPRVAGQISNIYVQPGDRVKAGQPLLQLDAAQQRAQVASRRATAETAAADIDTAQANVANAAETLRSLVAKRVSAQADVQFKQQEYRRFQQLTQAGASSQQTAAQKLNDLKAAEATFQASEAAIQAQKSSISAARSTVIRSQRALKAAQANTSEGAAQLQYYTISAPLPGIIGNIPVKTGDVVSNTTQLLTVTQNDRLEIQLQVPLERASALKAGLPVKLLDDRDREIQTGRISFIAPDVDPATQSIQAKASFSNLQNLRTAQFIRARVIWKENSGVLLPTSAISRLAGRNFVFVASAAKDADCPATGAAKKMSSDGLVAAQRPIQLGKIIGNDQEVVSGLSVRDRIIGSGILQLQNCAAIVDAAQMQQAPRQAGG
jgi:RND family efflux transporter MFP subunit